MGDEVKRFVFVELSNWTSVEYYELRSEIRYICEYELH